MTAEHPFPCWGFKALVQHLLKSNLLEILSKSRMHCHTRNVHSIMLLEAPQKTIRLFVAEPRHDLWRNNPGYYSDGMSVGFHAHHCDLTLVVTRGRVQNWQVHPQNPGIAVNGYAYKSSLRDEKPGFELLGRAHLGTTEVRTLTCGDSLFMPAEQMHTVSVAQGEWAAWLVFEGRESKNYSSVCYSTSDLEKADLSGLYKPMQEQDLMRLLDQGEMI